MLAVASLNSGLTQRRSLIHLPVLLERVHGTATAVLDSPTSTSPLSRTRLSRKGLKNNCGSKWLTFLTELTWLLPAARLEAVLGSRRIPSATSLALPGLVPVK